MSPEEQADNCIGDASSQDEEEDDDEVKQLLVDVPDLKRAFHVMNKIGSGKTYSVKRQYLVLLTVL